MPSPRKSLLVLHTALGPEARPDELDALQQSEDIQESCRALGWAVGAAAVDLDLAALERRLVDEPPACIFNLVEALAGRDRLIGLVPLLLESLALPFTGSGSAAIGLSTNKVLAKRWMRRHGIPTPEWFAGEAPEDEGDRWIVKSNWEHGSFGLDDSSVVRGAAAAAAAITARRATHGGDWFAERYVDGREFNIAVLEKNGLPVVLPLAEMTFVDYPPGKPEIVGYSAKWDAAAPEYGNTVRRFRTSGRREQTMLESLARECWDIFGLRGYARVDIRLDAGGAPQVLEINANPCLARDAGFMAAAGEAGLSQRDVIEQLLRSAGVQARSSLRRAG